MIVKISFHVAVFALFSCCLIASGESSLMGQTGQETGAASNGLDVPINGRSISTRDPIKWDATLDQKAQTKMTVVLDLNGLSRLFFLTDLKVTVGLYRKGKLIKTSQFKLPRGLKGVSGGNKYLLKLDLKAKWDSIKPLSLDGTINPTLYANEPKHSDIPGIA